MTDNNHLNDSDRRTPRRRSGGSGGTSENRRRAADHSDASKRKNMQNNTGWKKKRIQELRKRMAICIGALAGVIVLLAVGIKISNSHKEDSGLKKQTEEVAATSTTANVDMASQNAEEAANAQAVPTPQADQAAVTEPTPETAETEAAPVEEAIQEPVQEEQVSNLYNPASGEVVDRSNFAVDPNIPCGTDHNNGQKIVYLTLDDGPSYLTEQVLDILDQYGVKITFFVTAQDPDYFYLIREAYNRGHTIGLHSYTHDYATIYTSVDAYFDDLYRIGAVVQEQIGYIPCFIRFPGGEANMVSADYCVGIMSQLVAEVNARGFQYYNWHVSSGDGGNIDDVDTLVANATACDYPNIFVLSHDSGGKEATVQALPRIIEYYLSQGYEFRALDRDAFACHAEVMN